MRVPTRAILACLLATLATPFTGCVSEPARGDSSSGVRVRPEQQRQGQSSRAGARGDARLPEGPVASPAQSARSLTSHIVVALAPLGEVAYDGLVLPVVSPDARFIAVQSGDAPTWPTILAQRDAAPPITTAVSAFEAASPMSAPIPWPEPAPIGAILSGAATSAGFAVEQQRPDGSRALGIVSWASGRTRWTAPDDGAVRTAWSGAGEAEVWTERAAEAQDAALVHRARGREHRRAERAVSHHFPRLTGAGDGVYAWALSSGALELLRLAPASGDRLTVRARRTLARGADALVAYQSASVASASPAALPDLLLLFDPVAQRMSVFDPATGALLPLAPDSIAGCWHNDADAPGVFLTTPEGLVYQRLTQRAQRWEATDPVRVLAEPWVPRATTNPERPFVLIGPGRDGRLRLVAMRIVEDAPRP